MAFLAENSYQCVMADHWDKDPIALKCVVEVFARVDSEQIELLY